MGPDVEGEAEASPDGRAVGEDRTPPPGAAPESERGTTVGGQPGVLRGDPVGPAHGREVAGPAGPIPEPLDVLAPPEAVGGGRDVGPDLAGVPRGARRAGPARLERGVRRRHVLPREKGGLAVGPTKRGKGTKCMVVVDRQGVPLGHYLDAASPAEVTLVERTLETIKVPRNGPGRPRTRPERLIGDKAFDSDPLRERLDRRGIELIAPHRENRVRPPTQDGRKLRRYRRRWIVERTIAWLGNFRRLAVRWDRYVGMYAAFFHVAFVLIVLRRLRL